jgi:hypothetical protein
MFVDEQILLADDDDEIYHSINKIVNIFLLIETETDEIYLGAAQTTD